MKRTLMFLLLGPASVAFAVFWACVAELGAGHRDLAVIAALSLFILTVPVSACVGTVDGCLARTLPLASRAPLSALLGAAMAFGFICALSPPMSEVPLAFAMGGAICMGACSLLSNEGRRQRAAGAGR